MLAGIGHDLRTPLTRMKLELALLGDAPSVGGLRADVADMERMVESYLAFVRGEGEESPEPTDLKAMLDLLVAEARRETPSTRLIVEHGRARERTCAIAARIRGPVPARQI